MSLECTWFWIKTGRDTQMYIRGIQFDSTITWDLIGREGGVWDWNSPYLQADKIISVGDRHRDGTRESCNGCIIEYMTADSRSIQQIIIKGWSAQVIVDMIQENALS